MASYTHEGPHIVGSLHPSAADLLQAHSRIVLLSAETLAKQLQRHPDVTDTDYLALPDLLANPYLVLAIQPLRLHLLGGAGTSLMAVVKVTQDRSENYLVSLRRTGRPKDVLRMLARGRIVMGSAERWTRR